ncbi:MAG: hypothetical protein EHM90_01760, partial [Chloroflexi bacterium]
MSDPRQPAGPVLPDRVRGPLAPGRDAARVRRTGEWRPRPGRPAGVGSRGGGATDRSTRPALPADRGRTRRRARGRARAIERGHRVLSRLVVPERLPGIVDSHAHLQHEVFAHDLDAVLDRARAAGIDRILVPGWDRASSEAALELAARHPDLVDAAVGIHPHYAAMATDADWAELDALASDPGVLAVGEIGLDDFRNLSTPAAQREALARQ